ncbi:MAG: glycosyltransferase [Blastocatellia bacterium]
MLNPNQESLIEISVIVPAHNRPRELQECLRALSKQNYPINKFEVIVCDDGSTESVAEVIARARDLNLNVTHLRQEQRGPAAARNLGIRHASGEIIAMTDSDTVPKHDWLNNLYVSLIESPEAVGVEGKVYSLNDFEFFPLGEGPANTSGKVYLTCNCAYRRATLFQAGGFDETFPFPAYEDVELAAQIQKLGAILWQPKAIVLHPQRALTLRTVIKKLTHWEYVLITAFRFGYFAWPQYQTRFPRFRAIVLSVIALPVSKLKEAAECVFFSPSAAAKLAILGIAESLCALFLVVPKILFSDFTAKGIRKDYLNKGNLN